MDIFSTIYLGNSIQSYTIAFGIIFLGVFLGKSFNWLTKNILSKLVQKSKTRLDDIILEKLEKHLANILILFGIKIGLAQLILTEQVTILADQIIFILMTLIVAHGISRFLDALIEEYFVPLTEKSTNSETQFLPVIRKALNFAIWIIATILIINHAGYNVTSLLAGLGLGGLAFAMASKDYISNIFGGMTIFMDKTFKIKDKIKIGNYNGKVQEIGLRSTKLKTKEGTIITIPNSKFTGSMVENVSKAPAKKVSINLGITYETPLKKIEKAQKILLKIALDNQFVKNDSIVSFNHFGDSALNILFVIYVKKTANYFETMNDIHFEILKKFTKEQIEFAYPTQKIVK